MVSDNGQRKKKVCMSGKERTVRYPPHPCVANAVALSMNIESTCRKLSLLTGQLILALSLLLLDELRERCKLEHTSDNFW